jgi:hypothetical protein
MNKSELKSLIKEMLQDQHPLPQDTHATDLNELFDNSVMIQTSKGPYKFWADEDREEDNIKLFHYVKGPDGKEHDVNISPYEINWKSPAMIEKVKKWIESDMPNTKISENNLQENKTTMKKSELKALLKVIIQEVVAAKQKRIDETKGLSGFKKPSTSKNMGGLKEDILGMIREAISEMARTAGAVDPQFRKEIEPGKWVIMGHPNQEKYPDGSPTTAPKGTYQKLGSNPNMGRPKKVAPVSSVGGSDFDTATRGAIENILTAAPNTTDSDIMQQLSSSASEEEVSLNLDPAFVKKTASELRKELSADTDNQLDDAPESDLAAMSSSEEKRKAAQRAFIIKKLQAAKRAKQAIK